MANLEQQRVADLDCHVITSDKPTLITAIFCHGYGAPGVDLVSVGAQLLQLFPELLDHVQFIFPEGLLSLDDMGIPGGRAWWPLDLDRLALAAGQRDFEAMRKENPHGLLAARSKLKNLIEQVCETENQKCGNILLGGFSQGAMLATDVALDLPEPPAGLVVWSGTLINENEWRGRTSNLKDVPVIQSHGREDPILSYDAAIWLRDLFVAAEAKLNFVGFRGPHTIPKDAVSAVGQLLQRLVGIIE